MDSDAATTRGRQPVALVTGVGRTVGSGAAIATGLARSGWDVAFTSWTRRATGWPLR